LIAIPGLDPGIYEMPTDQVRGLKAHGSSPAMTNKKSDSTLLNSALKEWSHCEERAARRGNLVGPSPQRREIASLRSQ
jgi:hypothetical protein